MTVRVSLLVLSCLFSSVYCQVNIAVTPSNATLLVGQDLNIQCTIDGSSEVTVRINGEPTETNPRLVDTDPLSDPNNRTLQYTSVTREDNGLVFTCFVTGVPASDEVTLNVQFEPVYTFSEEEYSVNEGYMFVAVANVSANPDVMEADVVWRKGNTVLSQTSNIQCNSTTLTIMSASRDDAGNYSITGTNDIGMGSASFDLDVFFGPEFTSDGGRIDVSVGEALMIDCTTDDSNPPVQSVNISGTSLSQMTLSEGYRLYTVVNEVTADFNGRNYTCTASNGETMDMMITFTVYVAEVSTSVPSATSTASITSTSSTSSSSTGPAVTDVDTNTGGLSNGAIGGIVAGVIIGAIVIVALVVVVLVVVICCCGKKAKA